MHNNIDAAGFKGIIHACLQHNAMHNGGSRSHTSKRFVTTPAVPATEDSPAVPEQTTVETVTNMTPENRAHYESEKKLSFDIGLN
ncbi:hypothetical protein Tco_0084791 [Tanacetum coccineum]